MTIKINVVCAVLTVMLAASSTLQAAENNYPKVSKGTEDIRNFWSLLKDKSKEHTDVQAVQNNVKQIQPLALVRFSRSNAMAIGYASDGKPPETSSVVLSLEAIAASRDESGWLLQRMIPLGELRVFGGHLEVDAGRVNHAFIDLKMITNDCHQGFCASWLSIARLNKHDATLLAREIRLSANNLDARAGCSEPAFERADSTSIEMQSANLHAADFSEELATAAQEGCLSVIGRPRFSAVNSQMKITFSLRWKRSIDGAIKSTQVSALYQLINGRFVLEQGFNPVPEF